MIRKEIFENNKLDFEIIRRALYKEGKCAFDYSPEGVSRFGLVLTIIDPSEKLTTCFSGLHPALNSFLVVSISRRGYFSFNLSLKKPLYPTYVEEKLSISEPDAEGIAALLNYILGRDKDEK